MNLLKINNSVILVCDKEHIVGDYYQYILSLLKNAIEKNNLSINIILDGENYNFNNNNKTIKININYEHTLVKEGGRSVGNNTPRGKIKYNENKYYLVRIDKFEKLNLSDIIIDYSNPNIANVKQCGLYNDLSDKHIYLAPSLYKNLYINTNNRNNQSLTTFVNINEPRRKTLLEKISQSGLEHINKHNCFDKCKLQELYQNTKVLINIHQTPHHDTFEELRCLPALQNGVIVVSEKSPLSHLVPYNELIIWTDYDNIINKTKEVLEKYEEYHKNIFSKKNIDKLNSMDDENKKVMEDKIVSITNKMEVSNFLYIMIPKTCCVSIDSVLRNQQKIYDYNNLSKNTGIWSQQEISLINSGNKSLSFGHANLNTLLEKKIISYDTYENLYKFTVVRNPYDRLVSLYFYNKFNENMEFSELIKKIYTKKIIIPALDERNIIFLEGYNTIESHKFISQWNLQVDWIPEKCHILRYENINNDFKNLCKILCIDDVKLPELNNTKLKEKNYMNYYNNETIQMVNEIYAKDFEILKYDKILPIPKPLEFNINKWNKNDILNIVFYSNCQNKGISYFISEFLKMKGIKFTIDTSMQNYQMISKKTPLPQNLLSKANIFIYQPIDKKHGIYSTELSEESNIISYLNTNCLKIAFPYIYNSSTWAIVTPSPGDGITNGGFFSDTCKYINREVIEKLKIDNLTLEDIINRYKSNKINFNYRNRLNNELEILRKKEKKCDIIISDYIEENIFKQELFLNQGHPTTPLFVHCANQIIKILNDSFEYPYNYEEQYFAGDDRIPHSNMDKIFWKPQYKYKIDDSYILNHIKNIYNTCSKDLYSLESYCYLYKLDKMQYYDENANYIWGHNYIKSYKLLFDKLNISSIKNILEIGLGFILPSSENAFSQKLYKSGNSLRMWRDYFVNANIYGIDINKDLMFTEDRIKTFVANQNSGQELKAVIDQINSPIDIIIDDGSHQGEHQVFSFMCLHKYLTTNGIYVIEDVHEQHIEEFKDLSIFPENFKEYINQNFYVEYFDTRNTCGHYRKDDFMISFTKK